MDTGDWGNFELVDSGGTGLGPRAPAWFQIRSLWERREMRPPCDLRKKEMACLLIKRGLLGWPLLDRERGSTGRRDGEAVVLLPVVLPCAMNRGLYRSMQEFQAVGSDAKKRSAVM